ncbi:hypothetical protein LOTGIDRAFT_165756 [Lottia gigantea]|uniref:Ferric-chelate reductase 1 n=1 Tax=Lottia gigantea TaxID=225164 RepID=V3ZVA6_LOTGI|nr:hypothetical protein LOTGIDRAFT_165756 [Lottia gigantea]ESO88312.1 hypothetical protein LOTGIDRAFT_165756 [Lottia gigantea]
MATSTCFALKHQYSIKAYTFVDSMRCIITTKDMKLINENLKNAKKSYFPYSSFSMSVIYYHEEQLKLSLAIQPIKSGATKYDSKGKVMAIPLLFTIIALIPTYVIAFSRGAPDYQCDFMKPGHGAQSLDPSPFTITVYSDRLAPGSQVKVNISSSDSSLIMGLLVQARSRLEQRYLGSFTVASAGTRATCPAKNGLTHARRLNVPNLVMAWNAPATLQKGDDITFNVTIVENVQVYWQGIESLPIKVDQSAPALPSTTNNIPVATTQASPVVLHPIRATVIKPNTECGISVGCFQDCHHGKCRFAINWLSESPHITFEMTANTDGSADKWIAVGFSDDTKMGDDLVIECVVSGGQVEVHVSFNEGKENRRVDEFTHALIHPTGSYKDGVLYCSFTVDVHVDFGKQFTLHHYLMFAEGDSRDGRILPHLLTTLPMVSVNKVDFQSVRLLGIEEPQFPLVKAHGTLMMIGWLVLNSIGVVFARYAKPLWGNKTPFGIKIWFHTHRICMISTLILTLLALLLIVIEVDGISKMPDIPGRLYWQFHPVIGFIVVILTIANPIMALFRPDGDAPKRYIFNWCHKSVGFTSFALAVIAVFIGLDLNKSNAPKAFVAIMVIYIIYKTVFIILMEALPLIVKFKEENHEKAFKHGKCKRHIRLGLIGISWIT